MAMGSFKPLMGSPIRDYEELNLIASGMSLCPTFHPFRVLSNRISVIL